MVMKSMGFGSSLSTNIIPLQSFVGDPISNRGFHPRKKKKDQTKLVITNQGGVMLTKN